MWPRPPGPGSDGDADGADGDDASADVPAAHTPNAADDPADHVSHDPADPHTDRHHNAADRKRLRMLNVSEHTASYPHGTDRVVCSCGFDSGVVPGAFAWPDYDRDWSDNPVAAAWRRHVADVAFQALTALGWRFDDGEPMAGRDFDPNPSQHWTGCLCKWCTKEP